MDQCGYSYWSDFIPGGGVVTSIAMYNSDFVLMTGYFENIIDFAYCGGGQYFSLGATDGFLACFNKNGVFQWFYQIEGCCDEKANQVTVDNNNNIYVIGSFTSDVIHFGNGYALTNSNSSGLTSDIFIERYGWNGANLTPLRDGTASWNDYGNALVVCPGCATNHQLVFTGSKNGYIFANAVALNLTAAFTSLPIYAAGEGQNLGFYQTGADNYIYLSGTTLDNPSQDKKILLTKFWEQPAIFTNSFSKPYGSTSTQPADGDINTSLVVNPYTGNPYMAGSFTSTPALFPNIPGGYPLYCTNSPFPDIYIAKCNTGGIPDWLLQSEADNTEFLHDITLDSKSNPFITGDILGKCILGGFTLLSVNPLTTDAFVARIIDNGTTASFKNSQLVPDEQSKTNTYPEINIYPNPNNGIFTLEISKDFDEIKEISVFTIIGNKVKVEYKPLTVNGSYNINLSDLPKGIYFVKLKNSSNTWSKKVIIN